VDTSLGFRHVVRGEFASELLWRSCQFYEADIRVDAILAFPWMVRNQIGVFPHLKALALLEPEFQLLLGVHKDRRWETPYPKGGYPGVGVRISPGGAERVFTDQSSPVTAPKASDRGLPTNRRCMEPG
jgi:hypothetical protein